MKPFHASQKTNRAVCQGMDQMIDRHKKLTGQ